jgi:hypothetical protein
MRRVLSSWLLFGLVWIPAHALVAILVERRVTLTRAAFWAALLVPLVQAVAVESVDRRLFDGTLSRTFAAIVRTRALACVWFAGALALFVEGASAARLLDSRMSSRVAAAALAGAAVALAAQAFARRSGRSALLAAGSLLAGAALVFPEAARRLPTFGAPPAAPPFFAIVTGTVVAALLLLAVSRRSPPIGAALFAGAAGAVVAAGVTRALPALLGIPLDARRALPIEMLLTVAAVCAASAALAPDTSTPGSA